MEGREAGPKEGGDSGFELQGNQRRVSAPEERLLARGGRGHFLSG